jgi:hypothetical protein
MSFWYRHGRCKGEVVFQGPRWGLFSHFDQLGFRCPTNHNPADFVMFLIHKDGQGLVNVPFWEYWTSPKKVAIKKTIYRSWLGDVQWGHLMTHDRTEISAACGCR